MLGNSNLRTVKSLPFGEVRERIAVILYSSLSGFPIDK